MRILVTGRGSGGSWQIRGEQLGKAIGATVDPGGASLKGYDLAIAVKRPRADLLQRLRDAKVRIVWDVVDAWPQPAGNDWGKPECIDWLRREVDAIKPAAIVASTKVMATDCEQFSMPVLYLPHHARPGQRPNEIRESVQIVGYQGGDYLGHWQQKLERECSRRKWSFIVDRSKTADMQLADVDIAVAFRHQDGYAAKNWKSNVKLANAQGSGTPSVVGRYAGYLETANGRQYFADDELGLAAAFEALQYVEARREQVEKYHPPTLKEVAKDYRAWLHRL